MNILTDALPETVEIDGIVYPINTNFKDCLRVILAYEDPELTPQEKTIVLLSNLYPEPPHDLHQAVEKANWFLNGGDDISNEDSIRTISFAKDDNLIFSAFNQTHHIDLADANFHWWKFIALFMDLGQDTTFCQLVALRRRVKTNKATKEEQEIAHEMGEVFDVPELDNRTLEEKEQDADFMKLFNEGKKLRKEVE